MHTIYRNVSKKCYTQCRLSCSTHVELIKGGMIVYFSIEPKKSREDLYDRERELRKLHEAVENGRMVLLCGLRRIGKTSLLQVFLNETSNKIFHAFIDCRRLVRNNKIARDTFNATFLKSVRSAFKKGKLKDVLRSISKVKFGEFELDLSRENSDVDLFSYLDSVNEILTKHGKKMIIALDEAQNLRFYGRGGKDILNLFAYIYDHLNSIVVILTGSEIGLLHDFLKSNDPDTPLFGRYVNEISLGRFSKEKSMSFLSKGFQQIEIEIGKAEIEKAVATLDGIVGYLTMYGFTVYTRKEISTALGETEKMAQKLVKKEIEELRDRSENYLYILKAVAFGLDRFSKIKEYISLHHEKITDQTLSHNLSSLVKQSFLEQEYKRSSKIYVIPDPMVKATVLNMRKGS